MPYIFRCSCQRCICHINLRLSKHLFGFRFQPHSVYMKSWAGWTISPVTISTLISNSSVAFLQSHPSYRYSFLLRLLFIRTSGVDEYILRRWVGEREEECGTEWTSTEGEKDTPLDRGLDGSGEAVDSSSEEESSDSKDDALGTRTSPGGVASCVEAASALSSRMRAKPSSHDPPPCCFTSDTDSLVCRRRQQKDEPISRNKSSVSLPSMLPLEMTDRVWS